MMRAEIKQLQPKVSNRTIAKTLGVGRRTIDRDTGPNGPPAGKKLNQINAGKAPSGPNGPPPVVVAAADAAKMIARNERRREQQRRHRQRVREGRRACQIEIDAAIIEMLINNIWLDKDAAGDDRAVGCAIRRMLVEAAKPR